MRRQRRGSGRAAGRAAQDAVRQDAAPRPARCAGGRCGGQARIAQRLNARLRIRSKACLQGLEFTA
ncbi:hypothetical protein RZE79_31880 (plasmid) [Variovorax sp. EBFNA2]|nr:hypothetical protein [Variovorax boronicumulans]WPG41513.1 hypothetical protein RZE79_31880 [Variovorax boronicumulans]